MARSFVRAVLSAIVVIGLMTAYIPAEVHEASANLQQDQADVIRLGETTLECTSCWDRPQHRGDAKCGPGFGKGYYPWQDCHGQKECRLEELVKKSQARARVDLMSDVVLTGRLLDGDNNAPLQRFLVRLILPSGTILTSRTNGEGQFRIAIETIFDLDKVEPPRLFELKDRRFYPGPPVGNREPYYTIAILPEGVMPKGPA